MNWIDKLIQPIKDVREELTLRAKWESLEKHVPSWVKLVDFARFQKGCLVDVGSHYGLVSVFYIQHTGQNAYGFDVNERINHLVRTNIARTPFAGKLFVMGHGLSDAEGMVDSFRDTKYSGGTTIRPEQVDVAQHVIGITLSKREKVHVKRLDDVALPEPVAVMKIDCEGSEANVLEGAVQTIQTYAPAIIFEALTPKNLEECTTILRRLGYAVEKLDERNYLGVSVKKR